MLTCSFVHVYVDGAVAVAIDIAVALAVNVEGQQFETVLFSKDC
jgi:hypothetical protein